MTYMEQIEREDREELVEYIDASGMQWFLIKIDRRIPDPEWGSWITEVHVVNEEEWEEIQNAMEARMSVYCGEAMGFENLRFTLQPDDFQVISDDHAKIKSVVSILGKDVASINIPYRIRMTELATSIKKS